MSDAERLRAQIPASTAPERLRRLARADELLDLAHRVESEPPSRALDREVEKALRGLRARLNFTPRHTTGGKSAAHRAAVALRTLAVDYLGRG